MKHLSIFAVILCCLVIVFACNKSSENPSSSSSSNVQIRMTDAPFDAEEVNIDLRQVRIKYKGDNSWDTLQTNAGVYNLLQFQNGLDTLIASGNIPTTSTIKEVRFVLGPDNTIKIDNVVYPLTIPNGSEDGLKIRVNKKTSRSIEDILIDFDANLSIHRTGSGQYILKPVLKLK
ncbi:DUF4382 domain-containing protein [Aridibaculum aurantiacum]|uniref:DUF4382 domain-containing protein n=1 Tax=Aridibaculum aurantiacum TaxID=2810307 RepID=UPI001A962EEF|nr:DUF4382 domain-containing protein [Aridibaculum aurantiacum]